jgi:ribonucleotide reductase alpha subunit
MVATLLDYKTTTSLRSKLSTYAEDKINISTNGKLVFDDLYTSKLEDGTPETISDRMAAIAIDVASADLEYLLKKD